MLRAGIRAREFGTDVLVAIVLFQGCSMWCVVVANVSGEHDGEVDIEGRRRRKK
ncbi:hypothetical protein L209DRAFT_757970 [Thermothelomyces heterothallicus CBS 203.75]